MVQWASQVSQKSVLHLREVDRHMAQLRAPTALFEVAGRSVSGVAVYEWYT